MRRENEEPEVAWDREILKHYPSGVDVTQIEERLRLSPTERLEKMRGFLKFLEGARRRGGHRLSQAD
jgi:hypothetical protein